MKSHFGGNRRIKRRLALAAAMSALVPVVLGGSGCDSEPPKGTSPTAAGDAPPPIKLSDDTPIAFLTWIDKRGQTHTELGIDKVPVQGRDLVRVLTTEKANRNFFQVADLRQKQADGGYSVTVMAAKDWEKLIKDRRAAYRAQMAPQEKPTAAAGSEAKAIVYGASWCKPCHQAERFLKSKGVDVVMYDIEKEPARRREMSEKLSKAGRRSHSIPVIDVAGTILVGFNPSSITRAIQQAGGNGTKL